MNYHDLRGQFITAVESGDVASVRRIWTSTPELLAGTTLTIDNYLEDAARRDDVAMMTALCELGAQINTPVYGRGPEGIINQASTNGAIKVVRWLLSRGATLNHQVNGIIRCHALAGAAMNGHLEIVKLLIEHGAVFNYDWKDRNPLSLAMLYGQNEVVDYLKSKGALEPWQLRGDPYPGWTPAADTSTFDSQILEHIKEHLGSPQPLSLREILPCDPPITIHIVDVDEIKILVTSGMSLKAQNVPEKKDEWKYSELVFWLRGHWPLDEKSLSKPEYYWPIEWMRRIALFPHLNATWVGGLYAVFDNEDPPQPLAPGIPFTSVLVIASPADYGILELPDRNRIVFYDMFPLFPEERELERQQGIEALMSRFDEYSIIAADSIARTNVALR